MLLQEFVQIYLPIIANVAVIISLIASVIIPLVSLRRRTKVNIPNTVIVEETANKDNVYSTIYRSTIGVSYELLKQLYESTHRQSNSWFIFSGSLVSISILIIAAVFVIPPSTLYTVPLSMSLLSTLLNIIAISSFLRARQTNKEIDRYCSEKFLEANKISQLIYLIEDNPDSVARDRFKEQVVLELLIPMKEQETSAID